MVGLQEQVQDVCTTFGGDCGSRFVPFGRVRGVGTPFYVAVDPVVDAKLSRTINSEAVASFWFQEWHLRLPPRLWERPDQVLVAHIRAALQQKHKVNPSRISTPPERIHGSYVKPVSGAELLTLLAGNTPSANSGFFLMLQAGSECRVPNCGVVCSSWSLYCLHLSLRPD